MFGKRREAGGGKHTLTIVGIVLACLLFWAMFFEGSPTRHRHPRKGHGAEEADDAAEVATKPTNNKEGHIDWSGGTHIQLYNGVSMPLLGLGTAALEHPHPIITYAVQHGYTLLDTASDTGPWYHTEKTIGAAFGDYELNRADYFITTKLHPQDFGYDDAMKSFKQSLENLKTNYVDLYLLHYQGCNPSLCKSEPNGTWKEAWKALEQLYSEKKVRAIGVSNFNMDQLKQLLKIAKVKPHVVQNWFDPLHQDWAMVDFCRTRDIVYQSYSPLGSQHRKDPNPVLTHPVIVSLAEKHGRTPAQVVIRWMVQEGIPTIPRSNNQNHLKENFEIIHFALSKGDMEKIRAIGDRPKRS